MSLQIFITEILRILKDCNSVGDINFEVYVDDCLQIGGQNKISFTITGENVSRL